MKNISAFATCVSYLTCPSWCNWNETSSECSDLECYGGSADQQFCPSRAFSGPDQVPDVDTLTDEQISRTCLTMAQCTKPAAIHTVRDYNTKQIWIPSFSSFSASEGMNVPYNNFTLYKTRTNVNIISNTFYPRGSTAKNASIVRVDFYVKTKRVYMYVDMTCGAAEGYVKRGGFMGNGYFKEAVYQTPGMNIHNGMRSTDVGFTTNRLDYGDTQRNRKLNYVMVFEGKASRQTRKYFSGVTLHQTWIDISPVSAADAIPLHLDSAVGWAMLLPPVGNMPVASLYVHEAIKLLEQTKGQYSFKTAMAYGGSSFEDMKPAVEFLLRNRANLSAASACRASLPKTFASLNPPERGCFSNLINCITWRSPACDTFQKLMQAAKEILRYKTSTSLPRCVDCPGLLGTVRNNIPPENPLREKGLRKIPQCLPYKLPNHEILEDHSLLY